MLQGPFPAILSILDEDEGYLLLAALGSAKRRAESEYPEEAREYDKLYTKVLMACGDD